MIDDIPVCAVCGAEYHEYSGDYYPQCACQRRGFMRLLVDFFRVWVYNKLISG